MSSIGIVAIGRNEGERLRSCLTSLVGRGHTVVYVDSGSTDRSVELARYQGAEVIELDMSTPFTAARARNAGVDRLLSIDSGVAFIQFVDGDCEVVDGWLDRAHRELSAHPDWAVVCGRLRERFPERSVYNRLADLEWDTPIGEVKACGGIAMVRGSAFLQVGGFDASIIAGEEPNLCLRLRREGWRIHRTDAEMAVHDIAMTRPGQWWTRSVRSGHAYAEGAAMFGSAPERHWVREIMSICTWGMLLPMVSIGLAWLTTSLSLILLLAYPLLILRIARRCRSRGLSAAHALLYASSCMLGKFPQAIGAARYWLGRLRDHRARWLIDYK